jgi:hypothetical protein
MPWHVHKIPDYTIIETVYSGSLSADDVNQAAMATMELGMNLGIPLCLADCSRLEGGHSMFDLYDLSDELTSFLASISFKEALILPVDKNHTDKVRFWETTCLNRGLTVKVFDDRDSAIKWLIGENA